MKFLADINIPQSVIDTLTQLNHDVLDIKIFSLTDRDVTLINRSGKEKRIILTKDKDFLVLTQFPKYQVPTIIIRLKKQSSGDILRRLIELIDNQDEKILQKSLTIITEETAESYLY